MADRFIKDPDPEPKRQTMLMNTWFNFYGTVVAILDLILIVMGFLIVILSMVNDYNSHIRLNWAGGVLVLAAFYGLLGFLREDLSKLSLSWSLMIFVMLLLLQSALIGRLYGKELSLLISSDAEDSFDKHLYNYKNINNSDSNHTFEDKFKLRAFAVNSKYECCGWNYVEDMQSKENNSKENNSKENNSTGNKTYPCSCYGPKYDEKSKLERTCYDLKKTKDQNKKYEYKEEKTEYEFNNKTCKPVVEDIFKGDLDKILTVIMFTVFLCILSTILTFVISNDLLKVHNE